MFRSVLKYLVFAVLTAFVMSCSDDEEGVEYALVREVSEVSILTECSKDAKEDAACYQVRFRNPFDTANLVGVRLWIDTTVVDDTSKSVSSKQIEKGLLYEYKKGHLYDTIDLTNLVEEYYNLKRDSLQIALFCEYDDKDDDGSVYRLFMGFGDKYPPSIVSFQGDSTWSTGAKFDWYRPTDQTSFFAKSDLNGEIYGYNIRVYAKDTAENIRNLEIAIYTPKGKDLKGGELYQRDAVIRSQGDSIWVGEDKEKRKNELHLVVFDGEHFDNEDNEKNHFRIFLSGLRTRTALNEYEYTIAISSWDMAGNPSGSERSTSPAQSKTFTTMDSVAPVMPRRIFTIEDSLFPGSGLARLDSNNRLRIFWDRSVDPRNVKNDILSDSIVIIPEKCKVGVCYDNVETYMIDRYNKLTKSWEVYVEDDGEKDRFKDLYRLKNGEVISSNEGTLLTDTIRWTAPGDTVILRIRSKDKSGYLSAALIDTIYVSKGPLSKKVECPKGFVAVKSSDTSFFCMERFEHRNKSGEFVTGVLHSEAVSECYAVDASGFDVGLCKERDWELVCLSGGTFAYGVVEDGDMDANDYLFRFCNVSSNDSATASDLSKRDYRCVNPYGVRDMAGQYQEWVLGRSEDTVAVLKGASYKVYGGLDRASIAYCTNRSFPYYVRPEYTRDTVYLYREGTKVDTAFAADTSRTLYKMLTKKDFADSLQFYDVLDEANEKIGEDYSMYYEYKKGGKAWLDSLANGLTYKPSRVEAVFLTGKMLNYRMAAAFYKSSSIGFRCCAYPKK